MSRVGNPRAVQALAETPSNPDEPHRRSSSSMSLASSEASNDNIHTDTNANNDGGLDHPSPESPVTPSAVFRGELPHMERIALANRVRAKAWPLVGRNWYPEYHMAAYAGWMSVPGGLCVHKGQYHAFYQHHPFSENWGPMHWGHCVSDDLVHWRHLPVALAPGEPYDRDGCFSGSAVSHQGRLYLFYTGHCWGSSTNVNSEGIYQQQCLAVSDDDGVTFTKLGPIIRPPANYIHFRDPKVWRQDGRWWMVLGARDVTQDVGQLLLYSTENLQEWDGTAYRVVSRADDKNVFMWECPDFFPVSSVTLQETSSAPLQSQNSLLHAIHTNSSAAITLSAAAAAAASRNSSFTEGGSHNSAASPAIAAAAAVVTRTNSGGNNNNTNGGHSVESSSYKSNASSSVCASVANALATSDFVLIYCPQGMSGEGTRYRNRFQCGYLTGHWGARNAHAGSSYHSSTGNRHYSSNNTTITNMQSISSSRANLGGGGGGCQDTRDAFLSAGTRHSSPFRTAGEGGRQRKEFDITQHFKELDHGHDFYAPQTFVAPDGRRILVGWLDMWESPMPSKEHGWSGTLTVPRELVYDCSTQRLAMRPVRELAALRVASATVPAQVLCPNGELALVEDCTAFEVCFTFNIDNSTGEKFGFWLGRGAEVYYDAQTASVVVNRHYPDFMLSGYRACPFESIANGTLLKLHIFIDRSSLEVFINDGAACMSSRIYPEEGNRALRLFTTGGVAEVLEGTVWKLETGAVQH